MRRSDAFPPGYLSGLSYLIPIDPVSHEQELPIDAPAMSGMRVTLRLLYNPHGVKYDSLLSIPRIVVDDSSARKHVCG